MIICAPTGDAIIGWWPLEEMSQKQLELIVLRRAKKELIDQFQMIFCAPTGDAIIGWLALLGTKTSEKHVYQGQAPDCDIMS